MFWQLFGSLKQVKQRRKPKRSKVKKNQNVAAAVFFRTFGALPEVQFLHAIYHFKSLEVKNPTLQTVYELELKWGRYGLLKTTASSWRTNSHLANLELQRAKLKPTLRNGNGIQPHSHREAQLVKVILQLANLELNVRKWIPSCEINLRDFRKSSCNVRTGIFVHRLF